MTEGYRPPSRLGRQADRVSTTFPLDEIAAMIEIDYACTMHELSSQSYMANYAPDLELLDLLC